MSTALVQLDGVGMRLPEGCRWVVLARHVGRSRAQVSVWHRPRREWLLAHRVDGWVGRGGTVPDEQRVEGTGTTPLGTWRILFTFGTHRRRPGWASSYRRIGQRDHWVGDPRSPFYNQWRSSRQGGFRHRLGKGQPHQSERLADHPRAYEYAAALDHNLAQVRGRGFAIFLHVETGGPTEGCVSVPREVMRDLVARMAPRHEPVLVVVEAAA